jgi:hypothetical protein
VKSGREGSTIPIQLRGRLRSPNMTVTHAGTIDNPYGRRRREHRQYPDTSLMAMYRTFRCRTSHGKDLRGVCIVATPGPTVRMIPQTQDRIYKKTISDSTI